MKVLDLSFNQLFRIADGTVYLIGVLISNWTYDCTNTLTMDTWIKSRECHILSGILFVSILNSKTLCVLIVVKYMLITKYAFKTDLFSKRGQLSLVVVIWLFFIALAILYFLSVDLQTPICLPFQVTHSINNLPVMVNLLYSSYLLLCNYVIGYYYRQVYVCLKLSARNVSLKNIQGRKVCFRAVT